MSMSEERPKRELDPAKAYRDLNRNVQREDILRKFKDQSRFIPPTKKRGMKKARKLMLIRRNKDKISGVQTKTAEVKRKRF